MRTLKKLFTLFIQINYKLTSHLCSPNFVDIEFDRKVNDQLKKLSSAQVVIEAGGCDRPYFFIDKIEPLYVGLDIADDFDPTNFYDRYYSRSIEKKLPEKFDLLFSRYLMEHVRDNAQSYKNQIIACKPGGRIIHTYPLGFHPFSIANRLVGNRIARILIRIFRNESVATTGYQAFYNSGSARALNKVLGREGVKYKLSFYYDALDYFRFFYPLAFVIFIFNKIAKCLNLKIFASNVIVEIWKD